MKRTALLLAITAAVATAAANPTLSFVMSWPDNSVTVHIDPGTAAMEPGIVSQTLINGVVVCESFFDCPLYPDEGGGNIMLGDQNHGCPLQCNTKYSFRVRGSGQMDWSNYLIVHTGTCNSF